VGLDNASINHGDDLVTTTLDTSTILGTYEEENDSANLPREVAVGEVIEFDWAISPQNVAFNTE
jgi:hypothetical protein